MNPGSRLNPLLEDDIARGRKKIHESGVNEIFESTGRFLEIDDQSTLWFWHKFPLPNLFKEPPGYQLVEIEDEIVNANEKEIEDENEISSLEEIKIPSVVACFPLNDFFFLEVKYFPGPILNSFRKNFYLTIEFELKTKDDQGVPKELKGRELAMLSKIFAKLDSDFNSKRKVSLLLGSKHVAQITIRNELCYDFAEVLALELQIDLIDLQPEESEEEEALMPRGLINLGVTCYMNSYLQTIFQLKKFRYFINRLNNEGNENNFVFSLQSLFYMMEHMQSGAATTKSLVKSFGWNIQQIFTQQDVQEFSFMFLDAIEKKSLSLGIKDLVNKELFQGISESFISCKNIEFESKKEEVFADVQLAVKDTKNLHEALENYLACEELIEENAYDTEKFGKQDALKGLRFKKLPKVLIFHLSRFEFDFATEENIKLLSEFVYPETIDMAPYIGVRKNTVTKRKGSLNLPFAEENVHLNSKPNGMQLNHTNGVTSAENGTNVNAEEKMQLSTCKINCESEAQTKEKEKTEAQEKESDQKPSSILSNEEYKLFGVFVHFGFNSYSGHYEVYLKIGDQWFEFNDEKVAKVDFEEVKRKSYGGKKKVNVFETRGFRLKEKLRDTDAHAYMLVYVRTADFEDIVLNKGEKISYPDNVVSACTKELLSIENEIFRQNNYRIFLMTKETFIGRSTGRGTLFFTRVIYDPKEKTRFKKKALYKKFHVKQSILSEDLLLTLKNVEPVKPNERAFYFSWNTKQQEFFYMDFDHVYPNLNTDFKQFIYMHVEKFNIDQEINYPAFMIWKLFDAQKNKAYVQDIKLIGCEDSLASIKASIEVGESVPGVVCFEEMYNRRLHLIRATDDDENVIEKIKRRKQSSINFVFGFPESDQLLEQMIAAWSSYVKFYYLRIRSTDGRVKIAKNVANQTSFKDVFRLIREERDLVENEEVLIAISFENKSGNTATIVENGRDSIVGTAIIRNELLFTVLPAEKKLLERNSEAEGQIKKQIFYAPLRSIKVMNVNSLLDNLDLENEDSSWDAQLTKKVAQHPAILKLVTEDLAPFLQPHFPLKIEEIICINNNPNSFRPHAGIRFVSRIDYNIILMLKFVGQSADEPNQIFLNAQLNFLSNTRKGLRTNLYIQVPETCFVCEFIQFLQSIVPHIALLNPENQESFEPEYIKRNLSLTVRVGYHEYDVEQLKDLALSELHENPLQIQAVVNTDSFRNNIKINI